MTRLELEWQVAETTAGLGDDELRVLLLVARRLAEGQRTYGRLDIARDRRDWRHELGEEAADALVYAAIGALKREAQP